MENAYNEAMQFLSGTKNSIGYVSDAEADFVNSAEPEKYPPMAMKLFQKTRGLQAELVQQQQNSLQDKSFSSFLNKQASICTIESIQQLGTMPETEIIQATDEKKGLPQLPLKNILFEACITNQPLSASLRERWSTGTFYFLKHVVLWITIFLP